MRTEVCAYCGSDTKLTKEHLYPKSLYKRTTDYKLQYLASHEKFIDSQITIRDVCPTCNGGALSQLDSYFVELYDSQIKNIAFWHQSVTFRYNFNQLARWLLKTSYNSARVQKKEHQIKILQDFAPYILGAKDTPRRLALFVQLVVPTLLPTALDKPLHQLVAHKDYILPELERITELRPIIEGFPLGLARLVALNSYYFYLFSPPSDDISEKDWQQVLAIMMLQIKGMIELPHNRTMITLHASGTDATALLDPTSVTIQKFFGLYQNK